MYLWKEKDVLEAEQNREFLEHSEKRKVYQKRAAAAVRTKEEKMRVILQTASFEKEQIGMSNVEQKNMT